VTPDELTGRLADLATEPVDGPESAFIGALAARLQAIAGTRPAILAPIGPRPRLLPLRRPLVMTGVAAAVAAATMVATFVVRPAIASHQRVQLANAIDAEIIGPDGSVTPAAAGAVVPNGSVVRTGADGRTATGDTVLGPDSSAVAVDGRLVSPKERGDQSAGGSAGWRAHLQLTVRRVGGSIELRWTASPVQSTYGYLILRSPGSATPDVGRDVIGSAGAGSTSTRYATSDRGTTTFRVVAIDRQGHVTADSGPVTVSAG
jgi:hypothetical protein